MGDHTSFEQRDVQQQPQDEPAAGDLSWRMRDHPAVHERGDQDRHELPCAIGVGEYHAYFHGNRWSAGDEPFRRDGNGVDWLASEEWLAYDVDVRESGPYDFTARVAAADSFGGGSFVVVIDGLQVGEVAVDPTGGWYQWRTIESQFELPRGLHTLRLAVTDGGWKLDEFSLL